MLRSCLCDYSNPYTIVSETITITRAWADDDAKERDEKEKGVIFRNQEPFTDCINEINNTQIGYAKDLDLAMLMYNLIEYSNNYSKTSEILWQYYRDKPADATENSESFKSQIRVTWKSPADGNRKNVEMAVTLKYISSFWRTLEMILINCEINLILNWSENPIDPSFQGVNRLFVLSFKNEDDRNIFFHK